MNVAHLNTITATVAPQWDRQALQNRLRSIAMNAVREARVALGRDAGPWIDDDSRRQNMIFELLHLYEEVDYETEALPVVAPAQATPNEALDAIEKAMLKLDEELTPAEDIPPPPTAKAPRK